MKRSQFIKYISTFTVATSIMKTQAFNTFVNKLKPSAKMPVLFIGHGSPMNAIELNQFSATWQKLGKELPLPQAILCISAHWETNGTFVSVSANPKTIHDFGGFPKALFDVQYPALGSIELAKTTQESVTKTNVLPTEDWGLDHGAWSILKHLYPLANVPVVQMSIDYTKDAQYHYDLAKDLQKLRNKGVLIIGSGNMVHNLGLVAWNKINEPDYGFDWALEANSKMKNMLLNQQHDGLINYKKQGKSFELAIPSPEHYIPLIYTIALQDKNDKLSLFNDKPVLGSLTMTSVKIEAV